MRTTKDDTHTEPGPRDPRRLGEILPQLMARRGYNRVLAHERLVELWNQVSGSWAEHCRVGSLRRGVLEIVVRNSLIVQELTFQRRQFVQLLTQMAPEQKIRDLRFIVGPME